MCLTSFVFNAIAVCSQRNIRDAIVHNIGVELIILHNYYLNIEESLETATEKERVHLAHTLEIILTRLRLSVLEFERTTNLSSTGWWHRYIDESLLAFRNMDDSSFIAHSRLQRQILLDAIGAVVRGNGLVFHEFHDSLEGWQDFNFRLSNQSLLQILNAVSRESYELWSPNPIM